MYDTYAPGHARQAGPAHLGQAFQAGREGDRADSASYAPRQGHGGDRPRKLADEREQGRQRGWRDAMHPVAPLRVPQGFVSAGSLNPTPYTLNPTP